MQIQSEPGRVRHHSHWLEQSNDGVDVGSPNFLPFPCYAKSAFAASVAEGPRLSVSNSSLSRVYPSLFSSKSLRQVPMALPIVLFFLVVGMSTGCSQPGSNSPAGNAATTQPPPSSVPRTDFDRDLQFIRNGQFGYVWVFSREDGKPIDKDDAAYLRANAPQVVDWVTTDNGKRVIAGTNFDLEKGNLPQLRKRFVVEDYTGR